MLLKSTVMPAFAGMTTGILKRSSILFRRLGSMLSIKEYKFDYCTVQFRNDRIAEFEINEGVNVDTGMVAELTQLTEKHLPGAIGILSNRINSYSLSFEAMSAVAQFENLAALAIVVHSTKLRFLVEAQNHLISAIRKIPIKIFVDTDAALHWLQNAVQHTPNIPDPSQTNSFQNTPSNRTEQ